MLNAKINFGILMQKVFHNNPRIWRYWARWTLKMLNEKVNYELGRV